MSAAPASTEAVAAVGAFATASGVAYRVWAPGRRTVEAEVRGRRQVRRVRLAPEDGGYFAGHDPQGAAGDRYRYSLDGGALLPDMASRFQPEGVFGPSQVVDPRAYRWKDAGWRRPAFRQRVVYELHVGAFTEPGTFGAAVRRLDHLVDLGINTIELMPVADFPGRWGWGYDGVMLYAPARCYGRPDDLRALVDAAHARGLAVMLDVVYNHLGPSGNFLAQYSPRYFHPSRESPWGAGFNLDGERAGPVRAFLAQNAAYWLDEFHVDGLRLDATHAVEDGSARHLFAEIVEAAHARGAFAVVEDERNDAALVSAGGERSWNADGVWADDFHHSARVALTGERASYYASYRGSAAELADILGHGWLYRGQEFPHWKRPRGTESRQVPPERFVTCLANHDQIGNRALGDRLNRSVSPAAFRAASLAFCLTPYTPMLFMGQEWAASSPFPFFSDQPGELGEGMAESRRREFAARDYAPPPRVLEAMPDPQAEATFRSAKLDWEEPARPEHRAMLALYRSCLKLRASHEIFRNPARARWQVGAAGEAVILRWSHPEGDWLLVFCLKEGEVAPLNALTAPSAGRRWMTVLASEDARFGGAGAGPEAPAGAAPPLRGPAARLLRES